MGADALAKLRALSADDVAKGINLSAMNALYALYGARAHRAKVSLNPNNSTNVGEVAFRARAACH